MENIIFDKKWVKTPNGEYILGYKAGEREGTLHIYQSGDKWGIVLNTNMIKKDFGANCATRQEAYNKAKEIAVALYR